MYELTPPAIIRGCVHLWLLSLRCLGSNYPLPSQPHPRMVLFRKRRLAKVDASEGDSDPSRSELIQHPTRSQLTSGFTSSEKKQRIVGCVKVLLDIATESSDWFPPLKSALGGVSTLIKHYEVLVERMVVVHN